MSSRTLSKCDPLKEKGASVVSTPQEVVRVSHVIQIHFPLYESFPYNGANANPSSLPLCLACFQAAASDVVFLIVGYPSDVREVVLGPQGVLAGLKPGGIVVDMTTSEPSLAREIYEAAKAKGVHSVDAPVSGGDVGARNAALSIMVGAL